MSRDTGRGTGTRAVLARATGILTTAGVDSPENDAVLLLAHLWADGDARRTARRRLDDAEVPPEVVEAFEAAVRRRARREPLQHITGTAYFRYLELAVGPGVFVPRPETELLVDAVLRARPGRVPAPGTDAAEAPRALDLCSGSGALAIALATEWRTDVTAVELSPEALVYTRRNAAGYAAEVTRRGSRLTVLDGDALDPGTWWDGQPYDVVVSNPPYVPRSLQPQIPEVTGYDPALALYGGGDDGTDFPRALARTVRSLLVPGGLFVMEHDETQGDALRSTLAALGYADARTHRDYTGRDRFTTAATPEDTSPDTPPAPDHG